MKSTFEKLTANKSIVNGLQFNQINANLLKVDDSIKKTFAHGLKVADLFGIANNYLSDKSTKDELKSLNVTGNKYDILCELFNLGLTQVKLYIAVSKIPAEIVTEFKESKLPQTLEGLKKYANLTDEEKETTINKTREGITEKTETAKPKKLQTKAKHIEAKIHEGADKLEAIELIKELMKAYEITADELTATNVVESMAC
jgi:hypothetical protein